MWVRLNVNLWGDPVLGSGVEGCGCFARDGTGCDVLVALVDVYAFMGGG